MTYKDIINKIGHLPVLPDQKDILKNIFNNLEEEGYSPEEERIRIIVVSLDFLGHEYLMTEELPGEKKIDCSTLISQSFWEGAMIGIPFIAERQRTAPDGMPVTFEQLQPADIVIKFPNLESSFDKKHNHVGLMLGKCNGIRYVIESNSKEGCVISTLEKFDPKGGFRSYIKNERVTIDDEMYLFANKLSRLIPKLGRLGAKQHIKNSSFRSEHLGLDIFINEGKEIYAPIAGKIEPVLIEKENIPAVKITDAGKGMEVLIGNVVLDRDIDTVYEGQRVGTVFDFTHIHAVLYPQLQNQTHIHFEVRVKQQVGYWVNAMEAGEYRCINGLYAIKMGTIQSPLLEEADIFPVHANVLSNHQVTEGSMTALNIS